MRLGDVQNLYGKTLDAQALYQAAIGQSELALRQTEKNLAVERARRQSQIEEGQSSAGSGEAGLELERRLSPEKLRRYRLAWKGAAGPSVEIDPDAALPPRHRLDLNA